MKIIAYILIIIGVLFTAGMFYIIFTVENSFDIIIGWIFLGPFPMFLGIFLIRKIKANPMLDFFKRK